jgi:ATP-binding cassette subfamily A (ABC1) protein 3
VIAIVWKYMIFTGTHVLLILTTNVLLGLVLASHGLFISVPFGKSPQLAAVVSTLVAIASAGIVLGNQNLSSTSAIIYSLFLPGGFFMFAMHCICSWESVEIATNALKKDPGEFGARSLLPLLIIAAVRASLPRAAWRRLTKPLG